LNTNQKKLTTQNAAKQNYRYLDSIAFTTLREETRWAYSTVQHSRGHTGISTST